ncbi:hypothetical protein GSY74_04480, partial [Sulfurovum sp. bin170]|uniref:hypothetical protein n=1 Tax=Sulfurovum sp. bin170 TaxID=2695268 RepID=UPI0013DEF29F
MSGKDDFLDDILLREMLKRDQWISKNSAILVFHGIGYQKPLDTLDTFVRGILDTYIKANFKEELFKLTHMVEKIDDSSGGYLYRNSIRIEYDNFNYYLDCHEFYWADETEDQVSWMDTQSWIKTLIDGANSFYRKNLGELNRDNSFFFTDGVFHEKRYKFVMKFATGFIPVIGATIRQLGTLFRYIPFMGDLILNIIKSNSKSRSDKLTNLFGDIVAYNSPDPKSRLFQVRQTIKRKAYNSIKYLIETKSNDSTYKYDNIIVAAHSIGTQIAFDALNEIDHGIALKNIKRDAIPDVLSGFVTFGSHLDKAAFFFSEQIDNKAYIKMQIRKNFYAFKEKESEDDYPINLKNMLTPSLNSIVWRNYYDENDPV